jgi:tryptophanyl-tRNA synthetase
VTGQLGNYLGALSNWVKLQRDAAPDDQLLFSIVGWHALTMPQDPKTLSIGRTDMLAALLAIGLNPDRCIIFHQDHVRYYFHPPYGTVLNQVTESAPYRIGMDIELHFLCWETSQNDDMEGAYDSLFQR